MKKVQLGLLVEGKEINKLEGKMDNINKEKIDSYKTIKWDVNNLGRVGINTLHEAYKELILLANNNYPNKDYSIITEVREII